MNVTINYEPLFHEGGHAGGLRYSVDGTTSPVDAEAAAEVIVAFERKIAALRKDNATP